MKQGLFLMAIYALILNQVNKNDKALKTTDIKDIKTDFRAIGSPEKLKVDKYNFFDQQVFVVTSTEDKRKMLVFEDGTSYEVVDSKESKPARKATRHFANASLSWK